MSVSINQATSYYTDINSSYRNLEKFQNPADFAVTFKTFTGTGLYPQGIPLSPYNESSFFTPISIDPDLDNIDLQCFGATITDIVRDVNTTYLVGTTNNSGDFGFTYKNDVLYNSATITSINQRVGVIVKLTSLYYNTSLTGYHVDWVNYIFSNLTDGTEVQDVNIQFEQSGNLFVNTNLNFSNFGIYTHKPNDPGFNIYVLLNNLSGEMFTNHLGQFYNFTYYLTANGFLADFAGHNWGTHFIFSRYSLGRYTIGNLTDGYAKSNLLLDPSSNLYMSNNINTYDPLYKRATITEGPTSSTYLFRCASSPYGSYVYNNKFITCGYTIEVDPLKYKNGFPMSGCAFHYTTLDPYSYTYITSDPVSYTVAPLQTNGQYWTSVCFQECNGNLYAIAGYANVYLNPEQQFCSFSILLLDTNLYTHSTVATSPALSLAVLPGCITNGSHIYIASRAAGTNVNIYDFDSATNALVLTATVVNSLDAGAFGSYFFGQEIGSDFFFFEFPSSYISEAWNLPEPTQETFTYYVYLYNPAGPTLTQIATGQTTQDFRNASFQEIGGRVYMYLNYFNSLTVDVIDVTNPYAISYITTLGGKTAQTSNTIPFQITFDGITHDCILMALGGYQIYIMDNPYQPQIVFGQNLPESLVLQCYYNDYFYGASPLQTIWQLQQRFLPSTIVSLHSNINYQTYYPAPVSSASFGRFKTAQGSYVIIANSSLLEVWNVSNVNNSGLVVSDFAVSPFESVPKQTYCCIVENIVWIFFVCSIRCYIYTLDLSSFTFTYISTRGGISLSSFTQVSGYVQNNVQYILFLYDFIDPYPASLVKYTLDNTNGLLYQNDLIVGGTMVIDLPGYVCVAMQPFVWAPTNQQIVAVFLRVPYIPANNGESAYLLLVDASAASQLDVISAYNDISYPSYPQSFEVNTLHLNGGYQIALTVYNSPATNEYARYYHIILYDLFFTNVDVPYYVGYDAYTFEPDRQRCALTTLPYLDGFYIFKAGGFTGTTQSYLQISTYNISTNYVYSTNNIALGAFVNDMYVSTFEDKVTCVLLLNDGTLRLIDVTNPQYADENPNYTTNYLLYDVPPSFNSSFIHKVNQDGSADWLTNFGTTFDASPLLGQQIATTSIDADFNTNTITTVGVWNACFQVFEQTSTGSYVAINKLSFGDPYQINSFRVATDILTGQTKYIVPYIGQQNTILTDVAFQTYTSQYIMSCIATNNFNVYEKQVPGMFSNPIPIQKTLYSTSSSSSFVLSESRQGVYEWSTTLFTLDSQRNISLQSITFDNERISVVGSSNASIINVTDSTQSEKQILYIQAPVGTLSVTSAIVYTFNSTGVYLCSQSFELQQLTTDIWKYCIRLYPELNQMLVVPNWNASVAGSVDYHNKDGTIGASESLQTFFNFIYSTVAQYKYNSYYTDADNVNYSIAVFDKMPSFAWTGGAFDNYSFGIYNPYNTLVLNKDFIVRTNVTVDPDLPALVLNQIIDVSTLDRRFVLINGITGTESHWAGNLSKSPLANVLTYTTGPGANQITVQLLNPSLTLEELNNTTYYLVFPRDDGMGGITLQVIPVLLVEATGITDQFIFTIASLSDLESPVGGPLYGPYLYLSAYNESLYYNLQFYPGSIQNPVYFYVQVISLLIPNRPLLNLRKYGGQRNLKDMPYIYLQIYNEDDNGNYDPSILNVIYDNAPLGTKPAAQFKMPIPAYDPTVNFVNLISDNIPLVKFSPGFYNIRLRLLDFNGKVLQWDASATKPDDVTFEGGVVPEYLTNVYYRLAFTLKSK